jgi:hypothetical protein
MHEILQVRDLGVRLTDFLLFLHVAQEGNEWPSKDHHRAHENAEDGGDRSDKERPDAIPKRRTSRGWTTAASVWVGQPSSGFVFFLCWHSLILVRVGMSALGRSALKLELPSISPQIDHRDFPLSSVCDETTRHHAHRFPILRGHLDCNPPLAVAIRAAEQGIAANAATRSLFFDLFSWRGWI